MVGQLRTPISLTNNNLCSLLSDPKKYSFYSVHTTQVRSHSTYCVFHVSKSNYTYRILSLLRTRAFEWVTYLPIREVCTHIFHWSKAILKMEQLIKNVLYELFRLVWIYLWNAREFQSVKFFCNNFFLIQHKFKKRYSNLKRAAFQNKPTFSLKQTLGDSFLHRDLKKCLFQNTAL